VRAKRGMDKPRFSGERRSPENLGFYELLLQAGHYLVQCFAAGAELRLSER
jgi:hypothetical protein